MTGGGLLQGKFVCRPGWQAGKHAAYTTQGWRASPGCSSGPVWGWGPRAVSAVAKGTGARQRGKQHNWHAAGACHAGRPLVWQGVGWLTQRVVDDVQHSLHVVGRQVLGVVGLGGVVGEEAVVGALAHICSDARDFAHYKVGLWQLVASRSFRELDGVLADRVNTRYV